MWSRAMHGAMAWRRVSERRGRAAWLLWGLACLAQAQPASAPLQPEIASGFTAKQDVLAPHAMVATAHPLASQTALDILRAGGTAVDAAIAAQMVLGLVEPQSSGIGGGAFAVVYDPARREAPLTTYDGRETAPQSARDTLFLHNGQPMAFKDAVVGGRAVGTPGVLRMLAMAHQRHGRLPWARLFMPAVRLAEQGFAVSPRLHASLQADAALRQDPVARAYFYQDDGTPHPVGHVLRNPALAKVYRQVAQEGVDSFYRGPLAQEIVRKVRSHPTNPGGLNLADLRDYRAVQRAPLCFVHPAPQRRYLVCGMAPPSSGTVAVGQILGLMQRLPAAQKRWHDGPDAAWLHDYSEAARLAFADRALYMADPDFVSFGPGTWRALMDDTYLQERARLIGPKPMPQAPAGLVQADATTRYAASAPQPEYGTTHLSIVDAQGRAVALTSSIEDAFGARQMVRGFLLNNQLTDFSFVPADAQGRPVANRVEPGKRPRSSMTPLLVFDRDSNELLMSLGSPGGAMIIHYVARTLWALMHEGQSAQQAVDGANFGNLAGPVVLEEGRFAPGVLQGLRESGHALRVAPLASGLQVLRRVRIDGASQWQGGSDPRREGVVLGH